MSERRSAATTTSSRTNSSSSTTRSNDGGRNASTRVNTFTLVHEAIHQLTYNTGLLDRQADVPVAISEGLATFGEHARSPATAGQRWE